MRRPKTDPCMMVKGECKCAHKRCTVSTKVLFLMNEHYFINFAINITPSESIGTAWPVPYED